MNVDIEKLKCIPYRDRYLLFGSMREAQHMLDTSSNSAVSSIPDLIVYICLAYYHMFEHFIPGQGVEVNLEQTTITKTDDKPNTSYSRTTVPSMEPCKCIWYLNIDRKNEYGDIMIGITASHTEQNKNHKLTTHELSFAYLAYSGKSYQGKQNAFGDYGASFRSGDKITVRLDMLNATLSFDHNGMSQGIAASHLPKALDIEYKLGVTMNAEDTSISMTDFEMIYTE